MAKVFVSLNLSEILDKMQTLYTYKFLYTFSILFKTTIQWVDTACKNC